MDKDSSAQTCRELFQQYDILIWEINLPEYRGLCQEWCKFLANEEQVRATGFIFEKDRDRFIITHWALRCILASLLNISPKQLNFKKNPFGKPELSNLPLQNLIDFNLSYSKDIALIAVSHKRAIGVDIEYTGAEFNFDEIASANFTQEEIACLNQFQLPLRKEFFFRIWNGKEAYIKARGLGLSLPLNTFSAIPSLDSIKYKLEIHDHPGESDFWFLRSFDTKPGYTSAIAGRGDNNISIWPVNFRYDPYFDLV